MAQGFKAIRLPKDIGEFFLQEKVLKDAKKQNGIWIDGCSEQHKLEDFDKILNTLFTFAVIDYKDRALLEKLSFAAGKDFNTIVLEFVRKNGRGQSELNEDGERSDIVSDTAYADLACAFLEPRYKEMTAKTMLRHYIDLFPKQYEQVQRYENLLQESGNPEEALECLRVLFTAGADIQGILVAIYIMGYESLTKNIPLPFCIMYDKLTRSAERYDEEDRSSVEGLFAEYAVDDAVSSDDYKKPLQDFRSKTTLFGGVNPPQDQKHIQESKYFKKYLRKRREKMCEILKCSDEELARTLYTKRLGSAIVTSEQTALMDLIYANCIEQARYIETFLSIKGDEEKNIRILDEEVIPSFYYDKLRGYLDGFHVDGEEDELEELSKRDLYVVFGMGEIEKDIAFFSQYKHFCVFAKMLNYDKQALYRFFDFGQKKRGVNVGFVSLKRDLEKCREENKEKDEQIAALRKKARAPLPKAKNNNEKYLRSELAKAEKENDSLISENLELKNKIREMEEYIAAVEIGPETEEIIPETEIDEALIRSKRIAFVCGSQNVTALIKKEFPGSTILETATQTATRKDSTDLVVFFTQHIPHKMFYRFKSDYKGVPDLYYNGTNFDTLKRKICEVLKEVNSMRE